MEAGVRLVSRCEFFRLLITSPSKLTTGARPPNAPQFEYLAAEALPPNTTHGCHFSTIDIHVQHYLPWLRARFEQLGGVVRQARLKSVHQAVELVEAHPGGKVQKVVVCPGLGARDLEEVKDQGMVPIRGQVVRTSAPHCDAQACVDPGGSGTKHNWTGYSRCNRDGWRDTYMIPMGDGTFVVGGTRIEDDWCV